MDMPLIINTIHLHYGDISRKTPLFLSARVTSSAKVHQERFFQYLMIGILFNIIPDTSSKEKNDRVP
jgi:hypothetical protein